MMRSKRIATRKPGSDPIDWLTLGWLSFHRWYWNWSELCVWFCTCETQMAARRMWKMWNRNQEIWKQMVSKRVFFGILPELWTNMYCVSFYSVSSCIPHTLGRHTYIPPSYLWACIPQCKHKRQHLSSGHWRRLQSYRTKDCQSHNGMLRGCS